MAAAFRRHIGSAYLSVLPDMSKFKDILIRGIQAVGGEASDMLRDAAHQGLQDGMTAAQSSGAQLAATLSADVQQGVQQGVQAGAQAGAQAGTQAGTQVGAQAGVTAGLQQGAAQGAPTLGNNVNNATSSGVASGTRAGLGLGMKALGVIAAGAVAAAGIAKLFSDAIGEGLQQGFDSRKIQARLNLSGPEGEDLAKVMRELSNKKIFDEGVLESAASVALLATSELKKGSPEFKEAVNSLATLGDIYDFDLDMIGTSLSRFVKRGGTVPEYVDFLINGLSTTTGEMEDIADSLHEYMTEFSGLEQEFISLSAFLTEHGLRNTDVLADAIREMRTRASSGGEEWSAAIKAVGLDPKEVRESAARGGREWIETFSKILEGGGGLDLDFTAVLETLGGGPMADYARVFKDLTEADWDSFTLGAREGAATVEGLNELIEADPLVKLQQVGAQLRDILWEIAQPILEAVLPGLDSLQAWVTENKDALIDLGTVVADLLVPKLEWLMETIASVVEWISTHQAETKLLAGVLGFLFLGVLTLVTGALIQMGVAMVVATWPFAVAVALIGLIIYALYRFHNGILETFTSWGNFFHVVGEWFSDLWKSWSDFVLKIHGAINDFLIGIAEGIGEALGKLSRGISDFFYGIGDGVGTFLGTVSGGISDFFVGVGETLGDLFLGLWDWISGIFNGIGEFFDSIFGWIGAIIDGIKEMGGLAGGLFGGGGGGGLSGWVGIPGLAEGGTVLPRDGGTIVRLAEAGRAETVVDTGLLNQHLSSTLELINSDNGGGSPTLGDGINIQGNLVIQADSADTVRTLSKRIQNVAVFDGRRKR